MKEHLMIQQQENDDVKMARVAMKLAKAMKAEKARVKSLKRAEKEANQRRKINSHWEQVSLSSRYRKAAVREASKALTTKVESEMMDGIFLKLNERNNGKTMNVQKRILRRIVDKRQAQANHKIIGRTSDLFASHLSVEGTGRCMLALNKHQRRVG